jgi:hypothetical protein
MTMLRALALAYFRREGEQRTADRVLQYPWTEILRLQWPPPQWVQFLS